jgi:hypothetical protein
MSGKRQEHSGSKEDNLFVNNSHLTRLPKPEYDNIILNPTKHDVCPCLTGPVLFTLV